MQYICSILTDAKSLQMTWLNDSWKSGAKKHHPKSKQKGRECREITSEALPKKRSSVFSNI